MAAMVVSGCVHIAMGRGAAISQPHRKNEPVRLMWIKWFWNLLKPSSWSGTQNAKQKTLQTRLPWLIRSLSMACLELPSSTQGNWSRQTHWARTPGNSMWIFGDHMGNLSPKNPGCTRTASSAVAAAATNFLGDFVGDLSERCGIRGVGWVMKFPKLSKVLVFGKHKEPSFYPWAYWKTGTSMEQGSSRICQSAKTHWVHFDGICLQDSHIRSIVNLLRMPVERTNQSESVHGSRWLLPSFCGGVSYPMQISNSMTPWPHEHIGCLAFHPAPRHSIPTGAPRRCWRWSCTVDYATGFAQNSLVKSCSQFCTLLGHLPLLSCIITFTTEIWYLRVF